MIHQVESSRTGGQSGSWRRCLVLILIGLVGVVALPRVSQAAAPRAVTVEDVRVGFDGRYKVGTWTPIYLLLRGGPDGFVGEMHAVVEDENGTPTTVRQAVQVLPGATYRTTVYVRAGSIDSDFATLRFLDAKTGRQAVPPFSVGQALNDPNTAGKLEFLGKDDYQLITLGHAQGVEGIPKMPGYNASPGSRATNGGAREVAVTQIEALGVADRLPGRWYGYDSADALILDTADAEILAALNSNRLEAVRQWVERGGHLVVAVSSQWQAVNDGPLAAMLPARLVGQTQVSPFDSLESFTGGSQQLQFENEPVQVVKLEDVESRGGRVIASTLSTPLVVRGAYGFGRVTLVGFDVNAKPFAAWPDRTLFWVKALDLRKIATDTDSQAAASQRIFSQNLSDMSTLLRRSLDQFGGMMVVPFGWVAAFIAIYILLIGPGDYFFLKKVVKRMELTWITFPTIVVAVSLLAYYAAYKIKGTNIRVNQIDAVDVDMVNRITRGTTWLNLFSPQNRDYTIEVDPQSLTTGPAGAAPAGTEVVTTWFAAPEPGLGGMNRRGQGVGFAGAGYSYGPPGRAERLEDVRIGIWSTKGIVSRWFGPAPQAGSLLDVDLSPVGTDRLVGTVTNRMDVPLKNAMIAFGKQLYYRLGDIQPGGVVQLDTAENRALANQLQDARKVLIPPNGYVSDAKLINRADLVREIMFHDADASGLETVPSRTHHDMDLTGQLTLDRPMLIAEVNRPGAVLNLNETATDIKAEHTTVLRIILPLKQDTATPAPAPTQPKGSQP